MDSYVRAEKRKIHADVVVAAADFHDARLRDNSERYIVALSFNEKRNQLAESRTRAPHRLFLLLERNLDGDLKLNAAMCCAMFIVRPGLYCFVCTCVTFGQCTCLSLRLCRICTKEAISPAFPTLVSFPATHSSSDRRASFLSAASRALQTFEFDNEDSSSFLWLGKIE